MPSGTTTFNLDFLEIVEEAYERCGIEMRSGYDLRTARRSLNLLLAEWANRGINLWTVESASIALADGIATYNLPDDTVDVLEHVIRTIGPGGATSDIAIPRVAMPTYAVIPNKEVTGRPIQMYVDRKRDVPTVTLYPVPGNGGPYTLIVWYLRRLQDVGEGVDLQDVPVRMLPALIAGLAYQLSIKIPAATDRVGMLKGIYDEAWMAASAEDRDRAPVRFIPRVSRV
jgi:hypothetical protein